MVKSWVRPLFVVASLYDLVLGVTFLFWFKSIYGYFGVTLPNHDGYIQFAAAIVATFGIGFWFVAQAPERNRDIIKMGVLLKLSYSGVVLWHAFFGSVPSVWIPFAWLDLVFLGLFIGALRAVPVRA